jgi:hypothetical protein
LLGAKNAYEGCNADSRCCATRPAQLRVLWRRQRAPSVNGAHEGFASIFPGPHTRSSILSERTKSSILYLPRNYSGPHSFALFWSPFVCDVQQSRDFFSGEPRWTHRHSRWLPYVSKCFSRAATLPRTRRIVDRPRGPRMHGPDALREGTVAAVEVGRFLGSAPVPRRTHSGNLVDLLRLIVVRWVISWFPNQGK